MEREAPAEWSRVRLSDLGEVNRGRSRHRPRHAPHLYGGPYPFVQTGDIKASGGRITSHTQTYSAVGLAQSRLWPAGTMCITIAANIAETAILEYPACFPDSVIGFVANPRKCDVRFIEFMFRQLRRQIQHIASDSGTVQDNINLDFLENLYFPLPSLDEQKVIARVLGMLDDKIELNRRMNQTLEELARALFNDWLYRMDSELETATTQSLIDLGLLVIGDGYRAKRSELRPTGLPFARAGNIDGGFQFKDCEYMGADGIRAAGDKVSRPLDSVFTSKGTVGRLALVSKSTPIFVYAPQLCFWRAIDASRLNPFVLHQWMHSEEFCEQVDITKGQTDMADYVSLTDQRRMRITLPSSKRQAELGRHLERLYSTIDQNTTQIGTLAALRDALLPQLMSGELRIIDAEKLLAQTT